MSAGDAARGLQWPTYELIAIPSGNGVPESVAAQLSDVGIPRGLIGHEYQALPKAEMLAHSSRMIAFGTSGQHGRICIDAGSGHVIHIPLVGSVVAYGVNENMNLFRRCIAAVIERFPFYGEEDDSEEFESVAEEVRLIVSSIDESSLAHNGFWVTFADDLAIGDYATEFITG